MEVGEKEAGTVAFMASAMPSSSAESSCRTRITGATSACATRRM